MRPEHLVDVADAPPPLRELIEDRAARCGDRPFLELPGGLVLTYAGLDRLANRAADALRSLGADEDSIVMALCGNSRAMVATWLGAVKLGATFMPVNALLTGAPLAEVMRHSGGRIAVVDRALHEVLAGVRDDLPELRHVVVDVDGEPPRGAHSLDRLLDAASEAAPPPLRDDPAHPARLMYTSGTTGRPKGAVWSRCAEAWHAACYGDELVRVDPDEAVYSCLPLFHATCQGTLLGTLWRGARIAVDAGFDPFAFWRRVRECRAVFFPYVGTILDVLAQRPRQEADSDVPVRRVMGSAAPADRWRAIEERFGLHIEDVWGQTELASCWTRPLSAPATPGTVGRETWRFAARVVDESGRDVPEGAAGELWIRPVLPHLVFEGYLHDPGATARMWTEDGWYRTGDRLRRVADGDLAFAGRLRDAIRRRGEMIAPSAIEEAALAIAGVLEAAAVGVPAPGGVEEEIKLCLVAQGGEVLDPAGVHAELSRRLPQFMVPRYVEVYPCFPKTPTTRIQKYRLAADGIAGAWDARCRTGAAVSPAAGRRASR